MFSVPIGMVACASVPGRSPPIELPGLYYRMLQAATEGLASRLATEGVRNHTGAVLAGAVLYASSHPANPCQKDRPKLDLALLAGDMLATESESGRLKEWLNHRWILAPWIDGMRLLEKELGDERKARWRREIEKNLSEMAADVQEREDYPRYQSPFIRTSPNHLSIWTSTLYLGGKFFGRADWQNLAGRVMHRFAAVEQAADGYWGEHSDAGPTTGYNYLTTSSVALYAEHSGDPAAHAALRRALDFHEHFTWPDGSPVDVINDRNRHGGASPWGHYGFSNFADGRRYAEWLTGFCRGQNIRGDSLGRIAQNAMYFHEGPAAGIPSDRDAWVYQMKVPAGMRKNGPWWVCLSGLISTSAVRNQFYLDRQGHLSVFHEKTGLIISGANSKRQPELATFSEKFQGQVFYMPLSSQLEMGPSSDRLSLAYNSFWVDVREEVESASRLQFVVRITEQGRTEEARLNLQLCLTPDRVLDTGKAQVTPGKDPIVLDDVGGRVSQRGWTLTVDSPATLQWPVFPFNPYANAPETDLRYAVAALSIPIKMESKPERSKSFRTQEIRFALEVNADH